MTKSHVWVLVAWTLLSPGAMLLAMDDVKKGGVADVVREPSSYPSHPRWYHP